MSKWTKSDNSGVMLRLFSIWIFAGGALFESFPSQAKEIVVVCNIISQTVDELTFSPVENKKFVIKFDDEKKQVLYIGGEGIAPIQQTNFLDRFENEIVFYGKSMPFDGSYKVYSGIINRLSGEIDLRELYLLTDTDKRDSKKLIRHTFGDCIGGQRKF